MDRQHEGKAGIGIGCARQRHRQNDTQGDERAIVVTAQGDNQLKDAQQGRHNNAGQPGKVAHVEEHHNRNEKHERRNRPRAQQDSPQETE